MIKAISCDFWGTLAQSSPAFKAARLVFLSQHTDINIEETIKHIDDWCSVIEENYSKVVFTPEHRFFLLFQMLGIDPVKSDYYHLKEQIELLFITHPPIFDEKVSELLLEASAKGISVVITTNTGFMSGSVLRNIIRKKIAAFDVIASNEIGANKPNVRIFSAALHKIQQMSGNIRKDEIIHIGDNILTDIKGATDFGMKAIHVDKFRTLISITELL
jgi:putative hydrolase of the HAD superfamily